MPRTGRPKSENPKAEYLSVRIVPPLHAKLSQYAQENGITVAEATRRAIKKLLKVK